MKGVEFVPIFTHLMREECVHIILRVMLLARMKRVNCIEHVDRMERVKCGNVDDHKKLEQ